MCCYYLLKLATSFGHHGPTSGQLTLKNIKIEMLLYISQSILVYMGPYLQIKIIIFVYKQEYSNLRTPAF